MKLRDRLLDSLSGLPGTRQFHLHVLVSAPRRHSSLYPYADARPRVYAQDILVLVSEQPTAAVPRVLVTGIEATLYNVPAGACALLYVAKIDSTGQGARPSPTAPLVRALIGHFVREGRPRGAQRVWVHVFARAQAQYLFPNSAEHPLKRPLSDVRLCAWWKRLLGEVARDAAGADVALYYLLPGFDELEARQALGELSAPPGADAGAPAWVYGHPYTQTAVPLPCVAARRADGGGDAAVRYNLGQCIPWFDDDPKARFLDEIACTQKVDGVPSPRRKRARTENGEVRERERDAQEWEKEREKEKERAVGELGAVSPDEFWERMSFRQECISGTVTGFFVAVFSATPDSADASVPSLSPLAPQPGEVSYQMNRRLVASLLTGHDFSTTERAVRATEVLESAIKGLCEGLETRAGAVPAESDNGRRTPEPGAARLAPPPPQTPPRRGRAADAAAGVSPNPFPEPVTTVETYDTHICGSIAVCNAAAGPVGSGGATVGVTVLTVRKKRKEMSRV